MQKIKCDGTRPSCHYCVGSRLVCTYSRSLKKRGPRAGYIEQLEQRVQELESLLANDEPVVKIDSDLQPPMSTFFSYYPNFCLLDQEKLLRSPSFLGDVIFAYTLKHILHHLAKANEFYQKAKSAVDLSIQNSSYENIAALLLLSMYASSKIASFR